jgi:long-chain fatty acid transport protein
MARSQVGVRLHSAALVAVAVTGAPAFADGVEIEPVSPRALGTANAGRSATAEDASTVWWNPAGMTRLATPRFSLAAHRISVESLFVDEGTTDLTGAPMRTGRRRETSLAPIAPTLFVTYPFDEDFAAGFGVSAPFGLGTDYGERWAGRYFATETRALFLNFNPSVAWRLDEHWSVGAGLNAQHADVLFANMIDFGTIGAGAGLPVTPQNADGRIELEGDGWGFGYDAGVLWQPCEGTRIGTTYRAHIDHSINARADYRVPASVSGLTAGGAFTDTRAEIDISVPASWSLSAYHELDPRWALVFDVTWTGWHTREIEIDFSSRAQATIEEPLDWKNTFRWSLGAIHELDDDWTLRAGVALTDTPTKDATRDVRIPDEDRYWLAAGASCRLSKSVTLDFGYAYVGFLRAAQFDRDSSLSGHLEGEGHAKPWHTFSVGLSVEF